MNFTIGNVYEGWYFNLGRKEIFIYTNRTHKTQTFLSKILQKLELPDNPDTRKELSYYLIKANMEIKHCPETEFGPAHDYYNIFGKNFSGYGSEDINDGKTIIINMKGEQCNG